MEDRRLGETERSGKTGSQGRQWVREDSGVRGESGVREDIGVRGDSGVRKDRGGS